MEEIIGRLADILENVGKGLDDVSRLVFQPNSTMLAPLELQTALQRVGREGDLLGRVRLSLLTLERAIGFFGYNQASTGETSDLKPTVKTFTRDIQALEVHADFLSQRVAQATDATLGMINLSQNQTIKIVSVVAVRVPAAHGDRLGLWHELRAHARAGMALRLSHGARTDAGLGGGHLSVLQMAELAMTSKTDRRLSGSTPCLDGDDHPCGCRVLS